MVDLYYTFEGEFRMKFLNNLQKKRDNVYKETNKFFTDSWDFKEDRKILLGTDISI